MLAVQQSRPDEDMVVATPELVAFSYELGGIGSRFIAALLDLLLALVIILLVGLLAIGLGSATQSPEAGVLLFVFGSFALVYGYFWAQEAAFNGQTLGKRAARLRVVGQNGEPVSFSQAGIRNLVRFVDFLPLWYGIGLVTLFVNGRGRRLGDLAAGTVVVRERQRIRLQDLPTAVAPDVAASPLPEWSPALEDPAARRFLAAYAARRHQLDPWTQHRLAMTVEPLLRRWAPDVLARFGPEAALDSVAFSSTPPPGPPAPAAMAPPPPPPPPGAYPPPPPPLQ